MSNNETPVTVLGLGLMGRALASAFLAAGHRTTVWNRTPAKAEQLVGEGATVASSVGKAIAAGAVTIICLTDYRAVRELLDDPEIDLTDTTLVNLTSGNSTQSRDAALWAEQRGARYLDGAIMAIPSTIGTAEATILLSGPQPVFDAHQQPLETLGVNTYLGADPGLASLYDVAGLTMMWSVLNAWLQGTVMLRTAGVDATTFAPFARQIAAGVAEWLPGYAAQIDQGDYSVTVAPLETEARAMEHMVQESELLGVNTELPKLIKAMADRAIAAGHGGEQYPVLIEEFTRNHAN
ncbi:NAD(P)-binding domain-containing protein [Nocardia sp. NPDC052001]|uniref:NAD(P)-dependent oxidoreductase n=1 Tax=Nocardia sp. NPDC052001 TaxID=3154853 RepID=UPI00343468C1